MDQTCYTTKKKKKSLYASGLADSSSVMSVMFSHSVITREKIVRHCFICKQEYYPGFYLSQECFSHS